MTFTRRMVAGALALLLLGPSTALAQITVPNTFTTRQVISSAKMNQNFDELELKALNRTAPVLQASLLNSLTDTYDIGSSLLKFRDFYFSRNGLIGGTLGVTGVATFTAVPVFSAGVGALSATTGTFSSTLNVTGVTTLGSATVTTLTLTTLTCTSCVTATNLASTAVAAASYGSSTAIPTFTVDGDGRLTLASTAVVVAPAGTLTGATLAASVTASSLTTLGTVTAAGNVALLNAVNTFTAFGTHVWSAAAGSTGAQQIQVLNSSSTGATNLAGFIATNDASVSTFIRSYSSTFSTTGRTVANGGILENDGAGGLSVWASNAAGVIRFGTVTTERLKIDASGRIVIGASSYFLAGATNGFLLNTSGDTANLYNVLDNGTHNWYGGTTSSNKRWGINTAGDFTFGTSAHISDSSGTPVCGGSCSALAGNDYSFRFTIAATGATGTFGHTFSSAPSCQANPETVSIGGGTHFNVYAVVTSTTTFTVHSTSDVAGGSFPATVALLCRGF